MQARPATLAPMPPNKTWPEERGRNALHTTIQTIETVAKSRQGREDFRRGLMEMEKRKREEMSWKGVNRNRIQGQPKPEVKKLETQNRILITE